MENKNVTKVKYYYHTQHPYPFPGFLFLYVPILLSRQKILTDYLLWCLIFGAKKKNSSTSWDKILFIASEPVLFLKLDFQSEMKKYQGFSRIMIRPARRVKGA